MPLCLSPGEPVEASLEVAALLAVQEADDLAGLVQASQALADCGKPDAIGLVLVHLPSRPEAQHEAPFGDVVDGGGHLREHSGMPVGVARSHHAAAPPIDASR